MQQRLQPEQAVVAAARRIGDRRPVSEVAVAWPRPRRGRFGLAKGHAMADDAAVVVDLSMTGALVRAPVDRLLVEGSVVGVRLDGMAARVVVRRVTPEGGGMACYGVEFVDPTKALRAHLHSRVVPEHATPGWGWV